MRQTKPAPDAIAGDLRAGLTAGFTLVELLVAVGVLGVLAAISVPLYLGHVDRASDAAALAEVRNVKEAIAVYTSEHGVPAGGVTFDHLREAGFPVGGTAPSDLYTPSAMWAVLPSLLEVEEGIGNIHFMYNGSAGTYLIVADSRRVDSQCLGTNAPAPTLCTTDGDEYLAYWHFWNDWVPS